MAVSTWLDAFQPKAAIESTIHSFVSIPVVHIYESVVETGSLPPTEGQLWPRGNS